MAKKEPRLNKTYVKTVKSLDKKVKSLQKRKERIEERIMKMGPDAMKNPNVIAEYDDVQSKIETNTVAIVQKLANPKYVK